MKKDLFYKFNPDSHESKNYYRNGEPKNMIYKKCGHYFIYEYKTDYMHGIGNNLSGLIHALISHGNTTETVTVYKNGKLLKQWKHS